MRERASEAPASLDAHVVGDRGWFMYGTGILMATYMDNERLTDGSFDSYLRALDEDLSCLGPDTPRRAVLYEIGGTRAFVDAPRRKRVADVLSHHRSATAEATSGYVMVSASGVARGVLTAIFWLSHPPYPTQIVSTLDEGFGWLAQRASALDAESAMSGYVAARRTALRRYC